jgi:hypothetical protein
MLSSKGPEGVCGDSAHVALCIFESIAVFFGTH